MTRSEMISALSCEILRSTPTVYTFDMGLQYDYITPDGVGTGFGGIGEWPIIFLKGFAQTQWQNIRRKVRERTLSLEDLKGTSLDHFFRSAKTISQGSCSNCSEFFSGLQNLPEILPDLFYCLYDMKNYYDGPEFYAQKNSMLQAFQFRYCDDIIPWEDLSDHEIEEWYLRLDVEFSEIAKITFGFEEEDL